MKYSTEKCSSPLQRRAISAGWGAGYAILLHTAVWMALFIAFLAVPENGNHLPLLIAPACMMAAGVAGFWVVCGRTPSEAAFSAAVLLTHILLLALMAGAGDELWELARGWKGIQPHPDEPEGSLDILYFLLVWFALALAEGFLLLVSAVILQVRRRMRKRGGNAFPEGEN